MADFTERQSEIIEHALQLIAEQGIEKLTYRNLAGTLGITEPAFYRHFGSKAEILLGILVYFECVRRRLFEDIRARSTDSLGAIEAMVAGHLELLQAKPALTTLLFPEEIRQGRRELEAKVREMMRFGHQRIAAMAAEGIERGEIRRELDPEQLALIISGSMRLVVSQWRLDGYADDLREQGKRLWRTLSAMLRTEAAGHSGAEPAVTASRGDRGRRL
ncbi:MAG: TetR/AcrR family transcriptional regulator [Spirochaetales bacterium]|nr:TetR/AcrR family transcriptional regulator [Spirochaetales bacterium]